MKLIVLQPTYKFNEYEIGLIKYEGIILKYIFWLKEYKITKIINLKHNINIEVLNNANELQSFLKQVLYTYILTR